MKHFKRSSLAILCAVIAACSSSKQTPQDEFHLLKAHEQHYIALEDLKTHLIAYCHSSDDFSAEECAADLERRGFVRLTDVPKVTADKDFLTTGSYPSRRWRETDRIPRW